MWFHRFFLILAQKRCRYLHVFSHWRLFPKSMTIRLVLTIVGLLCVGAISAKSSFIEIRLKILNPYSGKPFANDTIRLIGSNDDLRTTAHTQDGIELTSQTGPDGVAHFFLRPPLPKKVFFHGATSERGGAGRGCSTRSQWLSEEIVRSGVVNDATLCVPNPRPKGKFRWQDVTAKPGEIVIFAVPPRAQW